MKAEQTRVRKEIRSRLSYSNVVATIALFLALCGATAFAASQLGRNSVGAGQLKKNSVTGAKVKDRSLRARDFARGQLPSGPPGIPGTSHGFEASGSVNFDKLSSSLFGSTAVSLPLPAGSYFATAAVTVETVNNMEKETSTVTCRLINGNGGPESTSVTTRSQPVRTDGTSDSFTLTALFRVTPGQALNLQCSKSAPISSARISDANIVAVQVSDISGSTE